MAGNQTTSGPQVAPQQPQAAAPQVGTFDPLALLNQIESNLSAAIQTINTTGTATVRELEAGAKKAALALHQFGDFLASFGQEDQPTPAPQPGGDVTPAPVAGTATNPARTDGAGAPPAALAACCQRLDKLKVQCQHKAHPAVAQATSGTVPGQPVGAPGGPLTDALLAQLITVAIDLVTSWIRKRFPNVSQVA